MIRLKEDFNKPQPEQVEKIFQKSVKEVRTPLFDQEDNKIIFLNQEGLIYSYDNH